MNRKSAAIAASVVAACLFPYTLRADTVSWNVDASGSWTTPLSNWSGNALPTTTSDVTIDRPAGDFIITLSSGTQTINSLFLAEQLTVSAGAVLSINTTFQVNNLLTLDGTLRNATVSVGAGGQITPISAILDAVKLNQDFSVTNDNLTITNGLTLNGGILRLIANAGTTALTLTNSQTLAGTGTVLFDGSLAAGPSLNGAFTLTIAPGITMKTGTAGASLTSRIINQGVISSETASRTITITSSFFNNSGTLQTLNGGAILLSTNLTTAQLGNFNASGGVITLNAGNTLDNTGNTLTLSGGARALTFRGILKGGLLDNVTGLTLIAPTFDNVTLATNLTILNDTLTNSNGLTFNGSTLTLTETAGTSQLSLTNTQTIGGTGRIVLDGTTTTGPTITAAAGTVTLGPGITVATGNNSATINPPGLINQGTISHTTAAKTLTLGGLTVANSGTIDIQNGVMVISGTLNNTGLLSVTNGGTAILNGDLTRTQLGNFDATGGTIRVNSILNLTGNTLTLTGGGNSLLIAGGIKGGVIDNVTGLSLNTPSFDNVTLATNLTLSADTITALNDLTLSGSTLTLTENTGTTALSISTNMTINGTGLILFNGTAVPQITGTGTLTLPTTIVARALSGAGIVPSGLINNGLISAEATAGTLSLTSAIFNNAGTVTATNGEMVLISGVFTNNGIIQAFNGSTIRFNGDVTTAQLGNFDATGGTIFFNTILNNTGNTLTLSGGAKSATIAGTLKGGVLANAAGLTLNTTLFDGVTLASDLTVPDQALSLVNGFTLTNANVHINENLGTAGITLTSNIPLAGTGSLIFDGPSTTGSAISGAFTLTLAPGITTRTGDGHGVISAAGLINQGLISAQTAGKTLTISSASVSNQGIFEARDGGMLLLTNPLLTVGGTFQASNNGTLRFQGGVLTIISPITLNNGNASFGATSTSALAISGTGSVTVDATKTLTSDAVNVSTWTINGTHILRFSATDSGTSAPGALVIAKSGSTYTGRLNLTNAKLIIDTANATDKTAKIAELFAAITSGAAGGAWTGTGINSSTAASDSHLAVALYDNADLQRLTFGGLPVDNNSLLITLAPAADANLDGKVDAFDLNLLAAHWQQQSAATAATGDFTRDGKVDAFDLNALAANWQFATAGSFEAALAASGIGALPVPEPASLGLLLPALLLLRPRRGHPHSPVSSPVTGFAPSVFAR